MPCSFNHTCLGIFKTMETNGNNMKTKQKRVVLKTMLEVGFYVICKYKCVTSLILEPLTRAIG